MFTNLDEAIANMVRDRVQEAHVVYVALVEQADARVADLALKLEQANEKIDALTEELQNLVADQDDAGVRLSELEGLHDKLDRAHHEHAEAGRDHERVERRLELRCDDLASKVQVLQDRIDRDVAAKEEMWQTGGSIRTEVADVGK